MMMLWRLLTISISRTRLSDMEFRWARQSVTFTPVVTLVVALACAVMLFPIAARAGWPERAVKLIVTFPPGSANDAAARIFADELSKKWGRPVVVEDKAGAEG